MTSGPARVLEEAFPEAYSDALAEVLQADRDMRKASARKAVALIRAHHVLVSPVLFQNRMLANRSFRAEVGALLNLSEKAAENLIGYSKVLVDAFPATLDALCTGTISWQHATVIVDEIGSMEPQARQGLETVLLGVAENLTPHKLGRAARLERERISPETIPARHEAAKQLRGVELGEDRDGMGGLFFRLKSVHSHAIFNKLTAGAQQLDGPLEDRTLDQRRADIFTHVMLASVDGQVFGVVPDEIDDENFVKWFRGITAEVAISVPVLNLLGQSDEPATLDGWVPIDPETARALTARAPSFTRILTHPETGAILSVGRKRYKTPPDLARMLRIRDSTCRFPGCEQPAYRCDLDHSEEWQHGGETKLTNLACLCPGHHTLKSAALWTVTQDDSGVMTWTSATGRTYRTWPHQPIAA
ncbi:MAG TPA: DUF222 domain-containing protein [Galbitalea sp.]|jgi:hypothetical protein|nr:DUF222 domain-containing protein [Galbitalea sp.]